MSVSALPGDLENIVLSFYEGLATPISLSAWLMVKYGEFDQLSTAKVEPANYTSHESFWADNSAIALLKKCVDLPTTFDRKAKAVETFWECERGCFRTNLRLSRYLDTPLYEESDDGIESFIVSVRKMIADILGPCPDLIEGRFGPGATYGDRGVYTTVPDKMSSRPTLTSGALPFLFQWTGTAWAKACASSDRQPDFIRGNRFTTVSKDNSKDRGIAIEPSVNLFYQLGYGRILKGRLRAAGIDLQYGQDIHRRVAREASIRRHLATIDLSNASDTVCLNLVKLLLPSRWFEIFMMLRSPMTLIEGKWVKLEKFSSMGNGFTFELESLIFLALSSCAVDATGVLKSTPGVNVFTFGDDIIVPTAAARNVIAVLQYFGMTINKRKSFVDGPFRESCGGDFFEGVAVRPYQLKEYPREPQDFIAMANGIRRLATSVSNAYYRDVYIRRAWFRILDAIPSDIRRCRGPEGLGDIVIHDEPLRWSTRVRSCIRYINVYRPARFRKIKWAHWRNDVQLATALYGVGDGAQGVTPRDAVLGHKVGWVPFS